MTKTATIGLTNAEKAEVSELFSFLAGNKMSRASLLWEEQIVQDVRNAMEAHLLGRSDVSGFPLTVLIKAETDLLEDLHHLEEDWVVCVETGLKASKELESLQRRIVALKKAAALSRQR